MHFSSVGVYLIVLGVRAEVSLSLTMVGVMLAGSFYPLLVELSHVPGPVWFNPLKHHVFIVLSSNFGINPVNN